MTGASFLKSKFLGTTIAFVSNESFQNQTVRLAKPSDIKGIAKTFAKAFYDDPVSSYFFPNDATRARALEKFFAIQVKYYLRKGIVYTNDDFHGASVWAAPNYKYGSVGEFFSLAPMLAVLKGGSSRAIRALNVLDSKHPHDFEHYYLSTLATHPQFQGKGVGSSMLKPILEICDSKAIPSYLESSKIENIPFYSSLGFKVTEEVSLPLNGPTLYLMWREPKN
ncbi:MAG: GNAT family N-acetyltransferase [Acidimicrobiales bacterium]|nr:GNAT family N-acetyltransferase [Acidimicrobiales bacterium]